MVASSSRSRIAELRSSWVRRAGVVVTRPSLHTGRPVSKLADGRNDVVPLCQAGRMIRNTLPSRPEARRLLVSKLLTCIGQGMTLPFLFVYFTRVRHLDATVVGLVVAWMGVLALVLAGPAGTLIDRFGARRVIL